MQIDVEMDHGPIIKQKAVVVPGWPVGFKTLQDTLAKTGARMLVEVLPEWIKGKIQAKEQKHENATFTKKVEKQDGLIDMKSAVQSKNYLKILAYEEWPRAFFEIEKDGKKNKVIITKASWKNNTLEIEKVIPEGKKEMDYKSFLLGHKLA